MILQRNVGQNIKRFYFRKGAVEIDNKILIQLHTGWKNEAQM
jgi:hypothetical protein